MIATVAVHADSAVADGSAGADGTIADYCSAAAAVHDDTVAVD